jgi:hypothetical protein
MLRDIHVFRNIDSQFSLEERFDNYWFSIVFHVFRPMMSELSRKKIQARKHFPCDLSASFLTQ